MTKREKSKVNEPLAVIVEMRVQRGTPAASVKQMASSLRAPSFRLDPDFEAVPIKPSSDQVAKLAAAGEETVIVRGTVEEDRIKDLEAQPNVIKVWRDTPIEPFVVRKTEEEVPAYLMPTAPTGPCPIPPCDCTFGNPANGTIAAVATYLGIDQIWAAGYKGMGIVIGIVDGGITAIGRAPKPGETAKVPRVIGGWPSDWGTTAKAWGDHGNMTATDALGMAPEGQIFDIRISGATSIAGNISNALQGFEWSINRHKADGTPHILSNSWGIFQENWDSVYATDPNHPFTRKVVEALDEGILVLFAAGNCGQTCPDGRCGTDNGPGKSIWGANGHPRVITVGAVNLNEQWVGYSSQGPAALDPNKPDFCSITHFAGYFPTLNPAHPSDGGTSAATPIAAGVVALLKQKKSGLTQDEVKAALKNTAKDIGPAGLDQHSGAGIIQGKAAYDSLLIAKLKFTDDVKLKFTDDVGKLKFQDDPPKTKFTDDVGKLKFQDDVKLKFTDDVGKLKFQDDVKLKFTDDVGKLKFQDDPPKTKFTDDVGKHKVTDDGKSKIVDDQRIVTGPRAFPQQVAGAGMPFILATPHHSMAWAGSMGQEPGDADYEKAIAQYEATLANLEQVIQQGVSELKALDALYLRVSEEHKALLEEYQRMKSGR